MATKKQTSVPPDKLRLYQKLLAAAGVDEKSNFGSAYTAVNGNMYSMISKYGVVGIALAEPDRDAFIKKYGAEPFRGDPKWPPSKTLIAVPDDLLPRTAVLKPYLRRSFEHAKSLKPKPATRKAR